MLRDGRYGVQILGEARDGDWSPIQNIQTGPKTHTKSSSVINEVLSKEVKQAEA